MSSSSVCLPESCPADKAFFAFLRVLFRTIEIGMVRRFSLIVRWVREKGNILKSHKKYDVLIIGSGITGLACARRLSQLGQKSIAVIDPSPTKGASWHCAGIAAGGQSDLYTRASHAHGADFAKEFWTFGDSAYFQLRDFVLSTNVSHRLLRKVRLATTSHEEKEMRLAHEQMVAAQLNSSLIEPRQTSAFPVPLTSRTKLIEDEGALSLVCDPAALREALARETANVDLISSVAHKVSVNDSHVTVETSGDVIEGEVVVLANHLAIGELLPQMRSSIVSVADQYVSVAIECDKNLPWEDISFQANLGYEWGYFVRESAHHVRGAIGGGRYLRPMAGIEATSAVVEPKITAHLLEQLQKTFTFAHSVRVEGKGTAGLDCRPCDELPIVGPMYGEPRILMATGYMGQGLTMGFLSGRCLAELIVSGKSAALPRRLWPERLRGLE